MTRASLRGWPVAALVVLLLAAGLVVLLDGPDRRTLTAEFDSTVGLYEGSDVRVMGLTVGRVVRIAPHGRGVRVEMEYDGQVRLPVGVKAVVVAPSVISDRFVQLTPGYVDGRALESGAVIASRDTRVPIELDDSISTATGLMEALGPEGADRGGALSDALQAFADVLDGTGDDSRATLRHLAGLSDTFADNAPALAANIRSLSRFTGTLATSDRDVAAFNEALVEVASALGDSSGQLSELLATLAGTLGEVATFVRDNRSLLVRDVTRLHHVTAALAAEKESLAEILDIAPLAFTDLTESYDAPARAVRTRANFGEVAKILDQVVCDALVKQLGPQIVPVCSQLHTLIHGGAKP